MEDQYLELTDGYEFNNNRGFIKGIPHENLIPDIFSRVTTGTTYLLYNDPDLGLKDYPIAITNHYLLYRENSEFNYVTKYLLDGVKDSSFIPCRVIGINEFNNYKYSKVLHYIGSECNNQYVNIRYQGGYIRANWRIKKDEFDDLFYLYTDRVELTEPLLSNFIHIIKYHANRI